MIRSMTGYGRGEAGSGDLRFTVEVKSVNNRYLDIQLKMPRSILAMETPLRKMVQDRFARGRFEVYISRNGGSERPGQHTVDDVLAGQYIAALRELKTRYGLPGDVDLAVIAGLPDIIRTAEIAEDPEAVWKVLESGMRDALAQLDAMRNTEGQALARDIESRLSLILGMAAEIRSKAPASVEAARKRMTETVSRLLTEQPDPARIAQEIAILAERTDITEELTRLESHHAQFTRFLRDHARDPVGRKLDFLIQEFGREVNTIGSKAMDAGISLHVVNIKAELEKIREQAQNIE